MKDDNKTKDKEELGKSSVKKDEKKLSSAVSNKKIRDLAEAYMKKKGMTMLHPKLTFDVSPERGAKIAKAYEEMKHEPENPKVKKAYNALIRETLDQWNEIKKTGLKVTKIAPDMDNPYPGGSKDVIKDIAENNHLFYFPTEQGYGSTDQQAGNHPMLQKVKVDGEEVPANDIFRIVHDYFGHVKEGHGFGPQGEENAWMTHKQMYSPEAQKALTSETRGQNSWVNFGPLGEQNRKNPSKTTYAEQKAGLMPDWVVDEEPTTGREKMADGGRVMMQDGGDPAAAMGDFENDPTLPAFMEGKSTLPQKPVVPSEQAPVAKDYDQDPTLPAFMQKMEEVAPKGPSAAPESSPVFATVWDISGAEPKLANVPHDQVVDGINAGKYSFDKTATVEMVAPDGDIIPVSGADVKNALADGLIYATPEMLAKNKFSDSGQQAVAFAESLARGLLTSPVASAIETNLGLATKEEILGREKAYPGTAMAGEIAGVAAPLILSGGSWALGKAGLQGAAGVTKGAATLASKAPLPYMLEKAGSMLPQGAKWYSKIGMGTVRGAFEGALFQGNVEAGKAYLEDPDQTAGSVASAVGLATLTGGAFGFGVSSIGQAARGLKGIHDKVVSDIKANVLGDEGLPPTGEPPTGGGPRPSEPSPETPIPPAEEAPPPNKEDYIRVNGKDVPEYEAGSTAEHVKYDPEIPPQLKQGFFQALQTPDKDAAFTQWLWEKWVQPRNPKGKIPASMISPNKYVWNMEQAMADKFTGQAVRDNIDAVVNAIHDNVTAITGTGQDVSRVSVGQTLLDPIIEQQQALNKVHSEIYDTIRQNTERVSLSKDLVNSTAEKMKQAFKALKKPEKGELYNFLQEKLEELALKENIDDLKLFATSINEDAMKAGGSVRSFGRQLATIVNDFESASIDAFAKSPNLEPELRATFEGLNAQRKAINEVFKTNYKKYERLSEILKAGKAESFADFANKLSELSPEKITQSLERGKIKYNDLMWFKNNFPEQFEILRKHELNKLVQSAKYTKGTDPRAGSILRSIFDKKTSDPAFNQLYFTPEELDVLRELHWLDRKLPFNTNPSGTGARMEALQFLATAATNPKFLAAQIGWGEAQRAGLSFMRPKAIKPSSVRPKTFADGGLVTDSTMNVPDYSVMMPNKQSFAKAILQPPQIQQAQKLAEAAVRGEKLITNSVKSVLDHKSEYKIPKPTPKGVDQIKDYVNKVKSNPDLLFDISNPNLPEMSGAFSKTIASAVGYLQQFEPKQPSALPFDMGVKMPPSTHADLYNHVAKIAEQPLYVLEKVKHGTVIPEEVGAVKTIYPALYQKLQNQIVDHLAEVKANNATIPYKTKIGLSAFLGSPIDTTFTPESIQAAQPMQQNQPPQGAQTGAQPKRSTSALGKMATMAQTPGQARAAERSSGKQDMVTFRRRRRQI